MMIHTKFNLPVETFRGEDSLTVFLNVVPKREKKKEKYLSSFFWEEKADWTQKGSNGH